jgi:hypothetical protein
MEQEVAYSQEGCNSRGALKFSGEITLMVHIYIEDGSPVLPFRMLLGAPDWMDLLSGVPEWMDP